MHPSNVCQSFGGAGIDIGLSVNEGLRLQLQFGGAVRSFCRAVEPYKWLELCSSRAQELPTEISAHIMSKCLNM